MSRSLLLVLVGLTVAALVSGCGGGDGGGNEPATAQYLPLAIGNVWRYTFTDYTAGTAVGSAQVHALARRPRGLTFRPAAVNTQAETAEDVVWINGTTQIGGATWYNAVSQYVGAEEQSVVYIRHTSQGLVRRDEVTDPGYYLLRTPLATGTTWTDTFDDRIRLTITGVNQTVTVGAGTFTQCIIVNDVFTETGEPDDIIRSWYAYGVGMVQQQHYVGATLADTLAMTEYTLAD